MANLEQTATLRTSIDDVFEGITNAAAGKALEPCIQNHAANILNHRLLGLRYRLAENWHRECPVKDIFNGSNIMNLKALKQFRLNVFLDVLLVLQRENQFMDTGAPCCENLFFYSADGQHVSAQRDFTGHRQTRFHRSVCECRDHCLSLI